MSPTPLHLSTILSNTPTGLFNQVTRLSAKYGNRGHTVLFALSANFPRSEDLQVAVEQLSNFNSAPDGSVQNRTGHVIGCLSDSFAGVSFQKLLGKGPKANSLGGADTLSCSIGVFDSTHCIPFRSDLAGRTQPQVGRWHAFRKKDEDRGSDAAKSTESGRLDWELMKNSAGGEVNWESIWSSSSAFPNLSSLLPESLKSIEQVIRISYCRSVFMLTAFY